MKRTAAIVFALIASLACAGERRAPEQPESAVIVIESSFSRQGIARNSAVTIHDPQTIAKLEAFFPKYKDIPFSDLASGWEHGYTVYFNFPKGKTLRVIVSQNGGGDTWSMVGGDLKTNGDFARFVKALQEQKPR